MEKTASDFVQPLFPRCSWSASHLALCLGQKCHGAEMSNSCSVVVIWPHFSVPTGWFKIADPSQMTWETRESVWGIVRPHNQTLGTFFFITFTAQSETFIHSVQVQLSNAVALIQTNAILGISKGTLKRIIFQFLSLSKTLHIMLSVMIAFDHRETVAADQQHNSLSMLEKNKTATHLDMTLSRPTLFYTEQPIQLIHVQAAISIVIQNSNAANSHRSFARIHVTFLLQTRQRFSKPFLFYFFVALQLSQSVYREVAVSEFCFSSQARGLQLGQTPV